MSKKKARPLHIVVVSGGTGHTGEQVVRAALAQFDRPEVRVVVEGQVRTPAAVKELVRRAKREHAMICQTLVVPELREAAVREAEALMVPIVDALGPVVALIADYLEAEPLNQPGLFHALNKEQFDRMDAVDFTLAHDDGQRAHELEAADVVLVGISRVSKSVTCFYLAYRGIRAANVSLALGIRPPDTLLALPTDKVVALTMNAHRLQAIREVRGQQWGGAMDSYADPRHIAQELATANKLIAVQGWRCIDVSYKAVEEVAAEIVSMKALE
jgi:regulator of PEP synthase PpsR (kinase-PPPase family)